MKSTFHIVDILFAALDSSAIKSVITGSICKQNRDFNSGKEDIVINSLPVNNEQLQEAIANVNIHVPDLVVNAGGGESFQPNHVRLKELTDLAIPILNNIQGADYYFTVQQQQTFSDAEAKDHYSNIRIEFFIENL